MDIAAANEQIREKKLQRNRKKNAAKSSRENPLTSVVGVVHIAMKTLASELSKEQNRINGKRKRKKKHIFEHLNQKHRTYRFPQRKIHHFGEWQKGE